MNDAISRCVRIDDWIFEVKMVRALKVDSYGKPYKAIAQMNINGDFAFLDGTLHADDSQFSEQDINTFKAMCATLDVTELRFSDEQFLTEYKEQATGRSFKLPHQNIA
ncbi:hypothetical protein HII17_01395 [Thalassotalea sp. M1531]|uniref:Uncharacterized protein n=1 Tax=Thalassotalea algicola TaxID=2716224 RepID=A0A7Y0L9E5_9GAMM|nr:hypothetical protein [Thalassotalea algicola]NMP30202.1 hypothetical protein [Thalassotalea algicola]